MAKKNNPTPSQTPSPHNPRPGTKGIELPRRPSQPKPQSNPKKN